MAECICGMIFSTEYWYWCSQCSKK